MVYSTFIMTREAKRDARLTKRYKRVAYALLTAVHGLGCRAKVPCRLHLTPHPPVSQLRQQNRPQSFRTRAFQILQWIARNESINLSGPLCRVSCRFVFQLSSPSDRGYMWSVDFLLCPVSPWPQVTKWQASKKFKCFTVPFAKIIV